MERLTYGLGSYNRTYGLVDKASVKPWLFTDYDGFYANLLAHYRLGQYEDILFDADGKELVTVEHLTELVKTEQKRREGCEFCRAVYTKQDWASGGAHDFRLHNGALYYYDAQFGWEGMNVNKCPMCGRDMRGESHDD